ncbi:hypothetical protein THAOC_35018 [Thalassiosira oceanica]|uniref:Mitofilin n=1 Tax=Thalassiosira oceanica TaxID=159749 RepID=K0R2J2_THAOC|nr:hypothetical protein THAOC_35018 [Thalassiosira oceanica]|eukprot:EJK46320.1 hypothetical protein THAOC_35018 [Thalassiosira oceanica]
MFARASFVRRTAALSARAPPQNRKLVTSAQKRALNQKQLKGDNVASSAKDPAVSSPGGGTAAAAESPAPPGGGGGGGAIFPLFALAGVGVGGAYYNGLIPDDYLPDFAKPATSPGTDVVASPINPPQELKEVVDEVIKEDKAVAVDETAPEVTEEITPEPQAAAVAGADEDQEEAVSLEHPEDGNRVDIDKIATFYDGVNEGHAKQQSEAQAREAASKATQFNEDNDTRTDPMEAVTTAANAMAELQSAATLENSQTLKVAKAELQANLDSEYLSNLESLSESELRVRVVQLATEMSDRTKWEAVRLKEFLTMKEKEVGDNYMGILQKQRLEFEALLAQKMREQEDLITRQANAALVAKDDSIQELLKATGEAREQETKNILTAETKRIHSALELDYKNKLANELGEMKQAYNAELEKHGTVLKSLREKLGMLESRLEVSRNYESGSKRAHRLSAAALALANKLEVGEGAAVELAALKGAVGDDTGVIASAVEIIPPRAKSCVPTVADLQSSFVNSYKVGRQAAMVPEGRAGLEGQLMGMVFAKLSVPPSPESVPTSDEEGNVADGILSLAKSYVQAGDLENAVEQLNKLTGQTAHVMADWKSKAMDRVSTERALKVIKLECALMNRDLASDSS